VREIVVLFSGGTDSTLAAALCAAKFDRVRLVTYERFGIANVENSRLNATMLMERFGPDKITHEIINIDELFKHVAYERYWESFKRHGFMLLSTCGLCKLSMHVRTVKYCVDNGIKSVCDGANSGMTMFPDQMKSVVEKLHAMYAEFGIDYSNPVFEYDAPDEPSFVDQGSVQALGEKLGNLTAKKISDFDKREQREEKPEKVTSGQILYQMNLAPAPNVKGTPYDRERQPRCFQFMLFNVFANKYFLPTKGYDAYEKATLAFFTEKIEMATKLLKEGDADRG
jgi:predicted subunit of tRNA(5-methylaminomethyl-2-thiouridylate) methyltransferase